MSNLNKSFKSVGRNVARAQNQSGSAKIPMKFADGGMVSTKPKADPPDVSGKGQARGGKAQTKGKGFAGVW